MDGWIDLTNDTHLIYKQTLMNFMKLFAEFINLICPFIDLDDTNTDCLPCDIELMASRLFFDYYKSLDSDCWVHVLRQPIDLERDVLGRNDVDDHDVDVFCARVATLAKLLISKEVNGSEGVYSIERKHLKFLFSHSICF